MNNTLRKMIIYVLFLIYLAIAGNLWSQEKEEPDFSKTFYTDLAGYHGVGKETSRSKEEALRLAKSIAIKKIFAEIGKDVFFQRMFISIMPQFIIVEASKLDVSEKEIEEGVEKTYNAIVRVVIDQNAIIMMEDRYSYTVAELLNKAEKKIQETEKFLMDAETGEINLRMSEALLYYRSARLRCREINDLLKNIEDSSIRSDLGNNLHMVKQVTGALLARADEGFSRLEKLETEIEQDSALEELVKTFELLQGEIENVEKVVNKYSPRQPFYDMPKAGLENIKIEIKTTLKKTKTINEKLSFLKEQIPGERRLLKEKAEISISELEAIEDRLVKMRKDVDLEIRDPRLARQERARKFRKALTNTGKVMKYIFFHEPADILSFRWYVPVEWPMDSTLKLSSNSSLDVRVEKSFESGFWIMSKLNLETMALLNANKHLSGSQELGMAYFKRTFLFGASLTWDWFRNMDSDVIEPTPVNKITTMKIYFGGVDRNKLRADWLLSFNYEIPGFIDPFIAAYQLNLAVDLLVRIENILLIETTLTTHAVQDTPAAGIISPEDLQYSFNWRGGLALRIPGPFGWGIYYNINRSAPINNASSAGEFVANDYWSAFIEYSF